MLPELTGKAAKLRKKDGGRFEQFISKADEQNEREVDSFEEELTKRDGGT